jgi:hydroxysqualene dehydroxylase
VSPRVAVIGGGLAGITAALDCADAGAEVTLFEVRPRLGGAAYSFEREGMIVDNGQHVFLRCCTEYLGLLDRLGTRHLTEMQKRLCIPIAAPGGRVGRIERSSLPAPLHLAAGLARYSLLSRGERFSAARTALALGRVNPDDPANDLRSFGDWLAERGQGANAMSALWDLIALPTLNVPAAHASLAQAAFVFQTGLLRDRSAGDIGWAAVPLQEVHGDAAERALREVGVDLRLRQKVDEVNVDGSGTFAVGDVVAESAIVAVPNMRAGGLLPAGAIDDPGRLERLGSSPIVNLHVVYDRPVLQHAFVAGVRSPVQYVFDRTRGGDFGGGQYLAVSLSGAAAEMELPPEKLREQYVPAIAEILPAARDAKVVRFFANREHAATFRAAPGQAALRPPNRTRIRGLALAGAWTATGWPATMEGAVRSGHAAARVALEAVRSPRPAPAGVAA